MPANTPRGYPYPLYSDPANFPAQSQAFATAVDTDVQAQVASIADALQSPSAAVSATANQAIANTTITVVTFATEDYDNAAMANLGVNNDRLTITETGFYLLSAFVTFATNGNAAGGRAMQIANLGGTAYGRQSLRGSATELVELSCTTAVSLTAADVIRVVVRQTSGASENITARAFSATKVAD